MESLDLNFILAFLEGFISFFSPCILPLLPLYIGYLSSNARTVKEDGTIYYKRHLVFLSTLCFVLGVSLSFFLLGFSFTSLGHFLKGSAPFLATIGGIFIFFLGCFQLGILKLPFLSKEYRIQKRASSSKKGLIFAFLLGLTFSLAWTPCVGPTLASILILASSKANMMIGNLYILVYALGFLLPFLFLGLFTTEALNFLKKYQKILQNLIKIGGILLIIMGSILIYEQAPKAYRILTTEESSIYFSLPDGKGNTYHLEDYKGKIVLINFWDRWCTVCQESLPKLETLYQKYGKNEKEVIILTVIANKNGQEEEQDILEYVAKHGYHYPVLLDQTGKTLDTYQITSYPSMVMISRDGNIAKQVTGAFHESEMERWIHQLLKS